MKNCHSVQWGLLQSDNHYALPPPHLSESSPQLAPRIRQFSASFTNENTREFLSQFPRFTRESCLKPTCSSNISLWNFAVFREFIPMIMSELPKFGILFQVGNFSKRLMKIHFWFWISLFWKGWSRKITYFCILSHKYGFHLFEVVFLIYKIVFSV